jgi:5-methylcytosine-specific restriction endonuclease McrA
MKFNDHTYMDTHLMGTDKKPSGSTIGAKRQNHLKRVGQTCAKQEKY